MENLDELEVIRIYMIRAEDPQTLKETETIYKSKKLILMEDITSIEEADEDSQIEFNVKYLTILFTIYGESICAVGKYSTFKDKFLKYREYIRDKEKNILHLTKGN